MEPWSSAHGVRNLVSAKVRNSKRRGHFGRGRGANGPENGHTGPPPPSSVVDQKSSNLLPEGVTLPFQHGWVRRIREACPNAVG